METKNENLSEIFSENLIEFTFANYCIIYQ